MNIGIRYFVVGGIGEGLMGLKDHINMVPEINAIGVRINREVFI